MARELTREEKAAIRKLVTRLCANYDRDVGCLPLDCPCYMLEKCWTGALCCYFREAVLPNDPVLEASLAAEGPTPETRPCPICGRAFLTNGRTRYCSPGCAKAALRQQKRNYMRKSAADAWKIKPRKRLYFKAFWGYFWSGQYVFIGCPDFGQMLSTLWAGTSGHLVPKSRPFLLTKRLTINSQA